MKTPGYCASCDVFGNDDSCWLCSKPYRVRRSPKWQGIHICDHSLRAQVIHGVTVEAEEVVSL